MENKAHAIAAGAFVLGLIAALVGLVIWFTRDNTVRNIYELSTRDAVSGLQPQAMVRYRGIAVGKVASIDFDPKVKGNVRVRITVDERVPLTTSSFATLSYQGVTGLAFIALDDKGESNVALKPNDDDPPRIPLKPGGFDRLLRQSDVIFTQVEQASIRLNKLLSDENQQAVSAAVTQLGEATGSINRVAKTLEPAVATLPALSRDASATLKSVKLATDEVGNTARRLNEKGGPLDQLSQSGTALAAGAETFSAATLPKLGEVADEAARTMRQLRRTVSAVGDNPQSLIFGNGPPQPGPGEPGFAVPGANK